MSKRIELLGPLAQIFAVLASVACVGDNPSTGLDDQVGIAESRAADFPVQTLAFTASDCAEIQTVVLRPLLELAEILPHPWEPADAAFILNQEGPTGMGAVLMPAWECAGDTSGATPALAQADVTIAVEPPPYTHQGSVDLHLYVIETYVPNGALADTLRNVGWPVREADIEVAGQGDPMNPIWSSAVTTEGAVQWATQSVGGAAATQDRKTARAWNVTSQGTGYFEYLYARALKGSAGPAICTLGSGTAAEETAAAGCASSSTVVFPETAWSSKFVFLPYVFPQDENGCIFGAPSSSTANRSICGGG